jgi:hypothetical protein
MGPKYAHAGPRTEFALQVVISPRIFLSRLYNTPSTRKMKARRHALFFLAGSPLSEPRSAPAHDIPLTYQLRIKLAAIKCQVDVKIDTVEGTLWRIHPFKILL